MAYKPGDTYYGEFTTCRFDTGAATDADTTPTATATRNGADDAAFALSVAKIDTGRYKVTGAIPAGYGAGTSVQISVAATVNSVAGKGVIDSFVMDSKRVGELNDAPAAPTAAQVRQELDANSAKLAYLDVPVSSRLAQASYAAAPTAVQVRQELDANSAKLAYLDAPVSSRSTYAGGTVAGVAAPVTIDMTQAVGTVNSANSLGDCLNAARAQGFGRWEKSGTALRLFAPDGTTVVRTFTLDDANNPTQRS